MKHQHVMIGMAMALLALPGVLLAQTPDSSTKVVHAATHDVSPPLRDIQWALPPVMRRVVGKRHYSKKALEALRQHLVSGGRLKPRGAHSTLPPLRKSALANPLIRVRDSRVQGAPAAASGNETTSVIGFEGIGVSGPPNFVPRYTRPDANAAVGLKYVVEAVNSKFAVYKKSDGSMVLGPADLSSLWANYGANCGQLSPRLVSPVVLYDQFAQRWIFVALEANTNSLCVAVSQTRDPTGRYYRYEYDGILPAGFSTDGFKVGVWSDAYYLSFNVFSNGVFSTELFMAMDRANLLRGKAGLAVIIATPNGSYSALPADVDGFKPPPADEPGLFMDYVSPNLYGPGQPYALMLWKMHVDWNDPSKSTLTGPVQITVPPFNDLLCKGSTACIPQPVPGSLLNSFSDRLMYRLAYRNFGDHEALVANQTVTANKDGKPPAGIRWYELDTSSAGAGDWSLKQSGSFDPGDGASRWLGSIAMDHSGDMALGYDLSGPSNSPSIAYTGRLAGDPAGKMTVPETLLAAGSGVQLSIGDWGAYSSMALDPGNDCNFWYTQEYYSGVSGSNLWSTHIGAFKFNACVPAPKGTLSGTVTDAKTGDPVRNAHVTIEPGGVEVYANDEGDYQVALATGDYTATAGGFGYVDDGESVTITKGDDTTENFSLNAAPSATVSGKVTDGSGHGYGLYAKVSVTTPGFGQVAELWTKVADGSYSVKLPKGFKYTFSASTVLAGYLPAQTTFTLSDNLTENFALVVAGTCSAPGYAFNLGGFGENFNGSWPPHGWTITNGVTGSPMLWNLNTFWQAFGSSDPNYTGGTGTSATMDDALSFVMFHYTGPYDTSLVTPSLAVTSLPAAPVLLYKANYAQGGLYSHDALDLDISVDGGPWQTVLHWTKSHGTFYGSPGENVKVGLGAFIPSGATSIRLRWRYYNLTALRDDYAQIDDVAIGACDPIPGGLIVGRVTDANTGVGIAKGQVTDDKKDQAPLLAPAPQSKGLATGTYVMFAPSGNRSLTVTADKYSTAHARVAVVNNQVVIKNFALGAGQLSANPKSFDVQAFVNEKNPEGLAVDNVGTAAAHYTLLAVSGSPAMASAGAGTQGEVVSQFKAGLSFNGIGVDRDAGDLWLGSPVVAGGDGRDHRFLFDGTNTGDLIDITSVDAYSSADLAFDPITGNLWQMAWTNSQTAPTSFIYEVDPKTGRLTGKQIKVPSAQGEYGLAFDPVTNTWFAGDLYSGAIYRFNSSGKLTRSAPFGKHIYGLTYNPTTGHLFTYGPVDPRANSPYNFYIVDTRHNYAIIGHFDLPGVLYGGGGAQPGLGHDCSGHLLVSAHRSSGYSVLEVNSGEKGWCSFKGLPWLTLTPKLGTVAKGATASVKVVFDGTGKQPGTSTQAYLKLVGNTPYPAKIIPITVHWQSQPVYLDLTGSANPTSPRKGDNLVYTLTVENAKKKGHGAAHDTKLIYPLPAGVSFVSGAVEGGAACSMAPTGSASASAKGAGMGTVMCDLGTLAQGISKTVTIAVRVEQAGKLTSHFEVTAREPNDSDKNALDLTATVIGTADIEVSAGNATLTQGQSGSLKVTVANAGPDPATGVKLKLSAGVNVKLQSATSGQGQCASSDGGIACDLGEIAAGGQAVVTVSVFGTTVGSAQLTAQATTTANDADSGNNVATAQLTVKAADNGGGGGALGWLALAALLGLGLTGAYARSRRG